MPSGSSIHISTSPQGSVTGSRMTGTPAVASRACSSRTFRTCIQIISERPGTPDASQDGPEGRTPGRRPGPGRRGRSGGFGPGRRGARGSGCLERPRHHSTITLGHTGRPSRARAVPPIGAVSDCLAITSRGTQIWIIGGCARGPVRGIGDCARAATSDGQRYVPGAKERRCLRYRWAGLYATNRRDGRAGCRRVLTAGQVAGLLRHQPR
jgi:hypothetical protein